jgi:hypothetical protein
MSPTQRTLAECRKRGWVCQVVEKWNPHARIRQDLFGCIDIVALVPGTEAIGGLCCVYRRQYDATPGSFTCRECGTTNHEKPGRILGIQACAGASHAARAAKMRAEPKALSWVKAGAFLEVWSWAKRGARGEVKRWTLREEVITP